MNKQRINKILTLGLGVFLVGLNIGALFLLWFSEGKKNGLLQDMQDKVAFLRGKFKGQKVLSVIKGDLQNNGGEVKVAKIQTVEGIILEFYETSNIGIKKIISRVSFPNMQDGYYMHRGKSMQLAIVDVDGDGKMELLSPTFDKNMIARLNPYHYSAKHGGFIPFFLSHEDEEE